MQVTWIDHHCASLRDWGVAGPSIADITVGLIETIGNAEFASDALSRLGRLVPAGAICAYRLSRCAPPEMLMAATLGRLDVSGPCWRAYHDGIYREDNSFEAVRDASGADQMAVSCVRAEEFPRAHRSRIYDAHELQERLSVIAMERQDAVLAVNLYRFKGEPAFSEANTSAIVAIAPVLVACVRRHYALRGPSSTVVNVKEDLTQKLRARCPALTKREIQVCVGLLQGWTFDGIASELDVSPTTVKTYRERAFRRLEIHHRHELFKVLHA